MKFSKKEKEQLIACIEEKIKRVEEKMVYWEKYVKKDYIGEEQIRFAEDRHNMHCSNLKDLTNLLEKLIKLESEEE